VTDASRQARWWGNGRPFRSRESRWHRSGELHQLHVVQRERRPDSLGPGYLQAPARPFHAGHGYRQRLV